MFECQMKITAKEQQDGQIEIEKGYGNIILKHNMLIFVLELGV
jgi:hypothetical protein